MSPKVSIVLINLNQRVHTRECIESLKQVTYPNVEIILIDNGSTDKSGERLREEFPDLVFDRMPENLGFSGGNNRGIQLALERGADYIMLLNNDTVVDKDFIQPLVTVAQRDPGVGGQCCKIYFFSDPKRLWYAGGNIHVDRALGSHRGINEEDRGQYDTVEDTGFASACMLFVPRRVVEAIGMLDGDLFTYFEDSDWCLRARRNGYRIVYNPRAQIWHKVSVTSRIDSPLYLYFTMRNKILFLRRHSRPSRWLRHLPYLVHFYLRHLIRMSLKWRSLAGTRAVIYGIIDGLRNYTGEHGRGRLDALTKEI